MEANGDRPASAQERAVASGAGTPRFQEAPACCTLKFPLSGLDVVVSLRDMSEQALLPRIRHLLAWAKSQGAYKTEDRRPDDKHSIVLHKPQQNNQVR